METIKLINVVNVEVHTISGGITKDVAQSEAFTSGAVRYIDAAILRPFGTARTMSNRLCQANGTRFLSGWAISDERLPIVLEGLKKYQQDVEAARENLVDNYEEHLANWETLHPEIKPWRNSFPKVHRARASGMSVAVYKIQPQDMESAGFDRNGVERELEGLPWQILEEIAQDVSEAWIPGSDRATQKIKGLLTRVRDKLRSLEFLGGNLRSIARAIEDVMSRLPAAGSITGPDFVMLSGLLHSLADPHRAAALGQQHDNVDAGELWETGAAADTESVDAPAVVADVQDVESAQADDAMLAILRRMSAGEISMSDATAQFAAAKAETESEVLTESQAQELVLLSDYSDQTATVIDDDAWSW